MHFIQYCNQYLFDIKFLSATWQLNLPFQRVKNLRKLLQVNPYVILKKSHKENIYPKPD